jgi:hypothetical protein
MPVHTSHRKTVRRRPGAGAAVRTKNAGPSKPRGPADAPVRERAARTAPRRPLRNGNEPGASRLSLVPRAATPLSGVAPMTSNKSATPSPAPFRAGDAMRPALTLPRFHPSVPAHLSRGVNTDIMACFTQALLAEGILKSGDWCGDLGQSIANGLDRWVNLELGAEMLQHYTCSFEYSNDLTCEYGQCVFGHTAFAHMRTETEDRPVGVFALDHDPYSDLPTVAVGGRVLQLEKLHKGLGFHILALIDDVVRNTTGGVTPKWAQWQHEEQWELNGGYDLLPEQVEESGLLTPQQFKAEVPVEAFTTKFNPRVLQRAMNTKRWNAEEGTIIADALRLHRLYKQLQQWEDKAEKTGFKHVLQITDDWPVVPIVVHWHEEVDPIVRVGDDYLESISQGGATSLVFVSDFLSDDVESIRAAISRMRLCLQLIVAVDGVLAKMRSSSRLIEIFGRNDPAVVANREERAERVRHRIQVRVAA